MDAMQSEQIGELAKALAQAQGEIEGAHKDRANPFFNSKYATLSSVRDACRDPLVKNGLAVTQTTRVTEKGTILRTTLMHTSGQWIAGDYPLNPVKPDPQAMGSCVSYGRRYSLAALVGVCPEDDDGEAAMDRTPAPAKPRPQRTAPRAAMPAESDAAAIARIKMEIAAADSEAALLAIRTATGKSYPQQDHPVRFAVSADYVARMAAVKARTNSGAQRARNDYDPPHGNAPDNTDIPGA